MLGRSSVSGTPRSKSKGVFRRRTWQPLTLAPEGGPLPAVRRRSVQGECDYSTLPAPLLTAHSRTERKGQATWAIHPRHSSPPFIPAMNDEAFWHVLCNCRKVAPHPIIWLETEGAQRKSCPTARQRRPLDNVLRPVGVFYVLLARKRVIIDDCHQYSGPPRALRRWRSQFSRRRTSRRRSVGERTAGCPVG